MFANTKAYSGFAVDDMPKAREFYGESLGVRTTEEYGLMTLHLAGARRWSIPSRTTPAAYTILNFEVEDIDQAVDELANRGVRFERYLGLEQDERGIMRAGGPYIAWFRDPAGNILSVLQHR